MFSWRGRGIIVLTLAAVVGVPHAANGGIISGANGESGKGSFTGTIDYFPYGADTAELDITLTNTSLPGNGWSPTAFAFNAPFKFDSIDLIIKPATFHLLGDPNFNNGIDGGPYGHFDIGASIGNSFLGGSQPSNGIGVGQTASFAFGLPPGPT